MTKIPTNGTPGFSLVFRERGRWLSHQAKAWRSISRIIFFIFITAVYTPPPFQGETCREAVSNICPFIS